MNGWEQFDIVIRTKNNQFFAGIPQIGLYAKGNDPNSALNALEEQKKALPDDLFDAFKVFNSGSASIAADKRNSWAIGRFALKLVLVVCLVGSGILYVGNTLALKFDRTIDRARDIFNNPQIVATVRRGIERAADSARKTPEAENQKILEDARVIVDRWRPIVSELMLVFSKPISPSPDKPVNAK